MFWVVAPVVLVGVAVAAIASSLSEGEKTARRRWQAKRAEVEKTVEEHRQNIEKHIAKAQKSYDFAFLCDLHYSSHRVGDSAYSLLDDARTSLASISSILDKTTAKRNELSDQVSASSGEKRRELLAEIRSLREFKDKVLEDYKTVKGQRDGLQSEVGRLNEQTRNLKEAIRDRCGVKGRDWYARLEERTAARRKKEEKSRSRKK